MFITLLLKKKTLSNLGADFDSASFIINIKYGGYLLWKK